LNRKRRVIPALAVFCFWPVSEGLFEDLGIQVGGEVRRRYRATMIRNHYLAGSLVALLALGCEQRIEHADPEAIRLADAQIGGHAAPQPAGTTSKPAHESPLSPQPKPVPALKPAPTPSPSAAARISSEPRVADRASFGAIHSRLAEEAAAMLGEIPAGDHSLRLFAYSAWHLDQSGQTDRARTFFQKARAANDLTPRAVRRSTGTSLLIYASAGRSYDDYSSLLAQSDRLLEEVMRDREYWQDPESVLRIPYTFLVPALVYADRYDEALRRLDGLKDPLLKLVVAVSLVRPLAARDRKANVRHCLDVMHLVADDERLRTYARELCSAHALIDDLEGAERRLKALPPPTDRASHQLPDAKGPQFHAGEFRPIVDVAAARRRAGDSVGCVRLVESELAELIRRDPPVGIAAWVECDEFERAATLVRTENDPALKARYAALLCRMLVERGQPEPARRFAAELAQLGYPSRANSDSTQGAGRFDVRFEKSELGTVVPLLIGDELSFRARIDRSTKVTHCDSLLRAASFVWSLENPGSRSYKPYENIPTSQVVFGTYR
jgi:hypothetical protein